jgi:hypothetical protein
MFEFLVPLIIFAVWWWMRGQLDKLQRALAARGPGLRHWRLEPGVLPSTCARCRRTSSSSASTRMPG